MTTRSNKRITRSAPRPATVSILLKKGKASLFMPERIFVALAMCVVAASSFSPVPHSVFVRQDQTPTLHLYSTSTDPSEMKLREIQAELKDMGVSYSDCFDRDSLTRRLKEARRGEVATPKTEPQSKEKDTTSSPSAESTFDRDATLQELRSLRVKELRTELANRNIRWGNMVEKEDLVQALLVAREAASNFSSSGVLMPGKVSDIDADTLTTELSTPAGTPLLLDVYATWCGYVMKSSFTLYGLHFLTSDLIDSHFLT